MENAKHYTRIVQKLRSFFLERDFVEVPVQSQVKILSACDDPETIMTTELGRNKWPLPQTGQMHLEDYFLSYPEEEGFFCITTSYRDEPNPIDGWHDKIFPIFEFETHGNMGDLIELEFELMDYLGFNAEPKTVDYEDLCKMYDTNLIGPEHEKEIPYAFSNVAAIKNFPTRSHPFFNVRRKPLDSNNYKKVDLILRGRETIGSAERAVNVEQMRGDFSKFKDGKYEQFLTREFGELRVMEELENYLSHDFIERCSGSIGITRLQQGLIEEGTLG